jgi:AbrB family looped-hinge helix DNA binding protein
MSEVNLFHGLVRVQSRGLIALPKRVRAKYRLDDPGAQVELTEREDGVIELRPALAIPATEKWFWEESWQSGEREIDAHVANGKISVTDGVDDFLQSLPQPAGSTE